MSDKLGATSVAKREALSALESWYASNPPLPYVIGAGLAITIALRAAFPLKEADYITVKNQVRISGGKISKILQSHGENRPFLAEGGRTTRGTRPAAESLADRLNRIEELFLADRDAVCDVLDSWLIDRVKDYFNKQRIRAEFSPNEPGPEIVGRILASAKEAGKAGAVAQHLVGAKLAIRYPDKEIENHSATTADVQLGRHGDFLVGDTVFHVTVAPTPGHVEKCGRNIGQNFRAVLLVSEERVEAAEQLVDIQGLSGRIGILSIESFVGQNVEEIGIFARATLATGWQALLDKYNERVAATEIDPSLQIEWPVNLTH